MPGMNRPMGGQMMPGGMGGGMGSGGGASWESAIAPGRNAGLQRGQMEIQNSQNALMKAQQQCAQGDGQACQLAQRLQAQLGQMMGQQQQGIGMAQMGTQRSMPGGIGGNRPSDMGSRMISSMYGAPGMGGSNLGSSRMGGGW